MLSDLLSTVSKYQLNLSGKKHPTHFHLSNGFRAVVVNLFSTTEHN